MSQYPDGSTNPNWKTNSVRVVPLHSSAPAFKVTVDQIRGLVCHRLNAAGQEEYLVQWKSARNIIPYSWHDLGELSTCLILLQEYIERLNTTPPPKPQNLRIPEISRGRKRKSPDSDGVSVQSSISRASPAPSYSSSSSSALEDYDDERVYNGTLRRENGKITMLVRSPSKGSAIKLPTTLMQQRASKTDTRQASHKISGEFDMQLQRACRGQPPITVSNAFGNGRPPLNFTFVDKSIPGTGVYVTGSGTVIGCGLTKIRGQQQTCRPNMGLSMGCQYGRVCECLEYAAVDTPRLNISEQAKYEAGEFARLPKRFPYHDPRGPHAGILVKFYLDSRHPIYECNPLCNCGAGCKTRLVQHGRKVPLEIFKTEKRGWGLRCTEDLKEGQFVDTYRGEIITNEEADRREEQATERKASYLYSLDKHVGSNDVKQEDCFVIDGEFIGGPTRFINHSCEPNCRQYTVSYNKNDLKIYELAFFAYKPIPANTELTFDYLDKDEEDEADEEKPLGTQESEGNDKTAMICYCGAKKCRGKLWI